MFGRKNEAKVWILSEGPPVYGRPFAMGVALFAQLFIG
jgi:hypothetical protein